MVFAYLVPDGIAIHCFMAKGDRVNQVTAFGDLHRRVQGYSQFIRWKPGIDSA